MIELENCPSSLQEILLMERSRERFTNENLLSATKVLGFGADGPLAVEYDDADIPESFIENAWRECVKRSWKDHENGAEQLREATLAFRILAEARGSIALRRIWDSGKDKLMNPDRAYDTLEVPKDVDDFMLITIYNMRVGVLALTISLDRHLSCHRWKSHHHSWRRCAKPCKLLLRCEIANGCASLLQLGGTVGVYFFTIKHILRFLINSW